mmetsp:Transcript_12903/g.35159  ORF Transcript_12903/g.35159 Transcript_12903/m.35159 type:complete len:202 (+) Transcript_12903:1173-1778(+)
MVQGARLWSCSRERAAAEQVTLASVAAAVFCGHVSGCGGGYIWPACSIVSFKSTLALPWHRRSWVQAGTRIEHFNCKITITFGLNQCVDCLITIQRVHCSCLCVCVCVCVAWMFTCHLAIVFLAQPGIKQSGIVMHTSTCPPLPSCCFLRPIFCITALIMMMNLLTKFLISGPAVCMQFHAQMYRLHSNQYKVFHRKQKEF